MILIDELIKNLLNILFPELCLICRSVMSDNEHGFCSDCRHDLPVMQYDSRNDNPVEKVLFGRVDIESATALLRFEKKGIVQQLLHNLKYRGAEEIGSLLGEWLGTQLRDDPRFDEIDLVIPVPMHRSKLKSRGYNQVELFGREIAKKIDSEYVNDLLVKTVSTPTKVFQKRFTRWQDQQTVFSLNNPDRYKDKRILLVDDIITTGATIEACASTLQGLDNVKISIATMAIAD